MKLLEKMLLFAHDYESFARLLDLVLFVSNLELNHVRIQEYDLQSDEILSHLVLAIVVMEAQSNFVAVVPIHVQEFSIIQSTIDETY